MAALASPTITFPEEDQQDQQQDPPLTEQGDEGDDDGVPSYDFYMEFINDPNQHEIPPFPTETTVLSVLPWQALPGVPGLNVDINALEPEVLSRCAAFLGTPMKHWTRQRRRTSINYLQNNCALQLPLPQNIALVVSFVQPAARDYAALRGACRGLRSIVMAVSFFYWLIARFLIDAPPCAATHCPHIDCFNHSGQGTIWTHLEFWTHRGNPRRLPSLMSIYHSEGAGDVRFLDLSATNIEPQELLAFAIPADAYAWKVVSLSLSSCWLLQPLSLMCVVQKFHALRILDISDMPGASPDVAKIASAALVYCDVLEHLNISKNDVRYTDLVKFFNRIPEFGDSLTNLEMAGMYITDVPAQVDLSTTNSFDVLWELLFDTDLSHLKISHCRISTGAMLLLIKTNLCLSDLRVDDSFATAARQSSTANGYARLGRYGRTRASRTAHGLRPTGSTTAKVASIGARLFLACVRSPKTCSLRTYWHRPGNGRAAVARAES